MNDMEIRRAQAHLYERVVRGDDDVELLFQKYIDLLDIEIIVGTNFTCTCGKDFESHPLNHGKALEEGLDIVLDFIMRGSCSCGAELPSHFYNHPASLRLVHAAAGFGHTKILLLLKKYGCDMNAKSKLFHRTPLSYAVQSRQLGVIDYLVSLDLDVSVTCLQYDNSPLHEAIQLRYVDVIYKLLSAKTVKINQVNAKGESPLICAARYHLHEGFLALLEAGPDCNVQDRKGNTALMMGVVRGMEYVKPLIEKGANTNIKNYRDQTALSFAMHMENSEIVSYLLENGGDPNIVSTDGTPPIVFASITGAYDITQKLVKHGAEVASKNVQGYTALHVAAWNGHCDIMQLLLDTGMNHDAQTQDGNTPLALAAHGNHTNIIDMLLPLGCNVNNADKDMDTPLLYATFNKNLEMVVKLVNAGANPDCRNKLNTTPLWNAVYTDSLRMVKYLLVKNVELEVASCGIDQHAHSDVATPIYPEPRSVLYVAADRSSMDLVMTLILAGYNIYQENWILAHEFPEDNPNLQSQQQQMLLHFASAPPRLLALCRNFFRRRFKKKVIDCVNSLEIPKNLKGNLILKNFIAEEFFKM
ncbi:serine/threonine-protein phosphatase 6 regulatory ankyrin repeat subunit A-like [Ostrea edulis]|uniref:serine/threonine-protein phosphatase 6 regulatory ankyrin repeat subunit A-like n=1 Tax=Ostrea edulis TaxID=37623 RepID=UPI0024AFA44B|nr:serine/threonine-protein phosphatase 6 regulatory ankyrin repeat subunit A-like [Ostrea edulis]